MHYIRLLRPPQLVSPVRHGTAALGLVLTITTDLGEAFFCPAQPLGLAATLEVEEEESRERDEAADQTRATDQADGTDQTDGTDRTDQTDETCPTLRRRVFELPLTTLAGPAKGTKQRAKTAASSASSAAAPATWRSGMRVLKLEARLSAEAIAVLWGASKASATTETETTETTARRGRRRQCLLCLRPADRARAVLRARQLVQRLDDSDDSDDSGDSDLIVPLWVDVPPTADAPFAHAALRRLAMTDGEGDGTGTGNGNGNGNGNGSGADRHAPAFVAVQEEIGESIARHVWDAGLVAVAFLADVCLADAGGQTVRPPARKKRRRGGAEQEAGARSGATAASLRPLLRDLLRDLLVRPRRLRVLELGSGVGILGIGLAAVADAAATAWSGSVTEIGSKTGSETGSETGSVLLTDLAEAEEQASANIERAVASWPQPRPLSSSSTAPVSPAVPAVSAALTSSLAFETLDWDQGRVGRFGPRVGRGSPWDLVVLSDCTYNVDMLPALVETLDALAVRQTAFPEAGAGAGAPAASTTAPTAAPRVLLARKPRHASEEALFALMAAHGWTARATHIVPLPALDGNADQVEIYLYERHGVP